MLRIATVQFLVILAATENFTSRMIAYPRRNDDIPITGSDGAINEEDISIRRCPHRSCSNRQHGRERLQ